MTKPIGVYRRFGRLFLILALNIFISVGIMGLVYYNRTSIRRWMQHDNSFSKEDKIIMSSFFDLQLIKDKKNLAYQPVKTSNDLSRYLQQLSLPDSLSLLEIYNNCKVIDTKPYRDQILSIKYTLFNDTIETFCYTKKIHPSGHNSKSGVLYISGTGCNMSVKVARRQLNKEDPCGQAVQIGADIYIPVFPADDLLAIHDGVRMLNINKISGHMVSIGRSVVLRFIADIFSIQKYLKTQYAVTHVWGHSRGGYIATVASAFFLPDTLIVSSGYSVLNDKVFGLGQDQAYWSKSATYFDKDNIKLLLKKAKTKTWFLFGKKEINDIYGLECTNKFTENFFSDSPSIMIRYVDDGHAWFSNEISNILAGK